MAVSPFGFSFQLDVTPQLAEIGIVWALAMGWPADCCRRCGGASAGDDCTAPT